MLWSYVQLDDGTQFAYSETRDDGTVRVAVERPVDLGFDWIGQDALSVGTSFPRKCPCSCNTRFQRPLAGHRFSDLHQHGIVRHSQPALNNH